MTEEEIKKIVKMTVKELKREGMAKEIDDVMFEDMSKRLYYHFNEGYSEEVARVLERIKTDFYYSIIPMYYGKRMTHEAIAEKLNVEVSTITRNKKRLCIDIYRLLE